mmetsp:Transcript_20260/g.54095  ORF Transcript_20260/g.54095 Transcript_20260/m.54095 type:complete len:204 (+) Transcript_20260:2273-2884(+)
MELLNLVPHNFPLLLHQTTYGEFVVVGLVIRDYTLPTAHNVARFAEELYGLVPVRSAESSSVHGMLLLLTEHHETVHARHLRASVMFATLKTKATDASLAMLHRGGRLHAFVTREGMLALFCHEVDALMRSEVAEVLVVIPLSSGRIAHRTKNLGVFAEKLLQARAARRMQAMQKLDLALPVLVRAKTRIWKGAAERHFAEDA